VAGCSELLHAPTTAVMAAKAPTAASRWIFLTRFQLLIGLPGRSGPHR
jgi:hypothetical protein